MEVVVERRLNSDNVLHCLTELFVQQGPPDHIRADNGSEFTAHAVRDWLGRIGVKTLYIEPWSPWENAVLLRPACRDLLRAGAAAVQQDHIVVLDLDTVQRAPDGGDVVEVLAAGEGDQGALGQMCGGLTVLAGAEVVAGVDGGGYLSSSPPPCPIMFFLRRRFSSESSATNSFKSRISWRRPLTSPEVARCPVSPASRFLPASKNSFDQL